MFTLKKDGIHHIRRYAHGAIYRQLFHSIKKYDIYIMDKSFIDSYTSTFEKFYILGRSIKVGVVTFNLFIPNI